MRLLLIDNYDSFTYNLYHGLGSLGADVVVVRNDAFDPKDMASRSGEYAAAVLSPGPANPDKAGHCLDFLTHLPEHIPVLGVCLGHQSLAQSQGSLVVGAQTIRHGKSSPVSHWGHPLFEGIPSPFTAMRYHSLGVDEQTLPSTMRVAARSDDDGTIMALVHDVRPWYGVQFHPESYGTPQGSTLLGNFLRLADQHKRFPPHVP